jgi:NAD(P)-dependent dehydrogenase (short-subunit alcohol dehydrogenase family)
MVRVFITGSSDGLGRMAADLLIEEGHAVAVPAAAMRRHTSIGSISPAEYEPPDSRGLKERGNRAFRSKAFWQSGQ